jgi:hypothetical protein
MQPLDLLHFALVVVKVLLDCGECLKIRSQKLEDGSLEDRRQKNSKQNPLTRLPNFNFRFQLN